MATAPTQQKINTPAAATKRPTVPAGKKNISVNKSTSKAPVKKQDRGKVLQFLKKVAKITTLPKDVRSSIPLRGFMSNGVIETDPGTFTKTYKIQDVNFSIAPENEQASIFKNFMDFLNSFEENVRWQFTIFNHEIDKKTTIENLRVAPVRDGLNKYRKELNGILLSALKNGNNLITQDKYLTVAIDDNNAEHAVTQLDRVDKDINKKLKKITRNDTVPLTTQERIQLLYDIYNQEGDYRLATGVMDNKEVFDLAHIAKCGLSVKDVIGPSSIDYRKTNSFKLGDIYGQAMYLERVPAFLSTDFVADLADIQCNMLISINSEAVNQEKAIKLVKNQLANIQGRVSAISKRNSEDGFVGGLPEELTRAEKNASDLMHDLTSRNQNIFFITFLVVVFARTEEQLEENVKLVKSTAGKHVVPIKPMSFQQEFCLNSALPLCRNDLFVERLYTTESASVFIPYNSQEINQKDAIYYGINQTSKRMVLYDRLTGDNYNGLIFGHSGSGKSFTAKFEMLSVLLKKQNAQVFVVDPQSEYYPLTRALHGQEIVLAPGSGVYINPLDLDISEDKDDDVDPITMKVDFVISMFDTILGQNRELDPIHVSILDRCTRKIYEGYMDHLKEKNIKCDINACPTLEFLRQELLRTAREDEKPEAKSLADIIEQYTVGSFDTFAHRTNVKTNHTYVVCNTKRLGTGMKELGLHICTNDIWYRMISNSKKGVFTYFYIDEFHVLLESKPTTRFLRRVWKMARKWKGVPTGIMQNTEDLLRDSDTRAIINNTSFVVMLKEPLMDRQNLQELFNLSNAQLDYINNSDQGHGLLFNGKAVLPFALDIPKNTELYRIFSTTADAEGVMFA